MSTDTDTSMGFTDSAAQKVRAMAVGQIALGNSAPESPMLRVYIEGGGCSGFQYGFDFEEAVDEEDTIIERDGVRLLIDPLSLQYLAGSTVDFKEDLQGSRFVIDNPNASTTCGCGASFSV